MKELRLCAGMTQRQVAKQLHISDQQMHKFENTKLRVPASQILPVADMFDLPVTDLFNGCDGGASLDPLRGFETRGYCSMCRVRFSSLSRSTRTRSFGWPGRWPPMLIPDRSSTGLARMRAKVARISGISRLGFASLP
jgi:DNA-binding XRE family transcriptional regulator